MKAITHENKTDSSPLDITNSLTWKKWQSVSSFQNYEAVIRTTIFSFYLKFPFLNGTLCVHDYNAASTFKESDYRTLCENEEIIKIMRYSVIQTIL